MVFRQAGLPWTACLPALLTCTCITSPAPPACPVSLPPRLPCCSAAAGDAPAAALETELLRVAAMHALQHMQGDVQQVVGSSLGQHRPLAKYSAGAGAAAPAANGHQTERAARYTAQGEAVQGARSYHVEQCTLLSARAWQQERRQQDSSPVSPSPLAPACFRCAPAPAVLLDLLQGIPSASLLRMQPGDSYRHASHAVVLQVGGRGGQGEALPLAVLCRRRRTRRSV